MAIKIEVLDAIATLNEIEALADVLVACVQSGASLGFMLPYGLDEARLFWREVTESVRGGSTILLVAKFEGDIVGTVQLGLAPRPN